MFVSKYAHFSLLSAFVAQFSDGEVECDSVEEYELLTGNTNDNYSLISWFKGKVYILLICNNLGWDYVRLIHRSFPLKLVGYVNFGQRVEPSC